MRDSLMRMMRTMLAGMAILFCVASDDRPCSAADPGSRERAFLRALELFDNAQSPDDYRRAARELESIAADGYVNGAVYYNLGNAWYRAGEYGRAILSYRKAKPFRPRDSYLEANLQQALAAAPGRLNEPARPWWSHVLFWSHWLPYSRRVQSAAVLVMIAPLLMLTSVVVGRKSLLPGGVLLTALGLVLGLEVWLNNPHAVRRAVITAETVARKGTADDYEPAFDKPLKDGAEFTVLNQTGDWTFGDFDGIGEAWVRNEYIAY